MKDSKSFSLGDAEDSGTAKSVKRKFMVLVLGESNFAIPLSEVREVIASPQLTILPNMPSYFAGVINLRGKIISTVYLKKSLSSLKNSDRETSSRKPCVVITDIQGKLFGAYVDDVSEVVSIDQSQIDQSSTSEIDAQGLFQGIIKLKEQKMAPILNMEKALRLDELTKKMIQ